MNKPVTPWDWFLSTGLANSLVIMVKMIRQILYCFMKILVVIYDVCSFDIEIYHVFCDNVNWQSITSFKKMSKLTWHGLFSRMIRIIKKCKNVTFKKLSELTWHCLLSRMIRTKAVSISRICHNAWYKKMSELTRCCLFFISIRITDSVIRICSMSTGTHWNSEQQIKQLETQILFTILRKPGQCLIRNRNYYLSRLELLARQKIMKY